jgi:hypothetical protein
MTIMLESRGERAPSKGGQVSLPSAQALIAPGSTAIAE